MWGVPLPSFTAHTVLYWRDRFSYTSVDSGTQWCSTPCILYLPHARRLICYTSVPTPLYRRWKLITRMPPETLVIQIIREIRNLPSVVCPTSNTWSLMGDTRGVAISWWNKPPYLGHNPVYHPPTYPYKNPIIPSHGQCVTGRYGCLDVTIRRLRQQNPLLSPTSAQVGHTIDRWNTPGDFPWTFLTNTTIDSSGHPTTQQSRLTRHTVVDS